MKGRMMVSHSLLTLAAPTTAYSQHIPSIFHKSTVQLQSGVQRRLGDVDGETLLYTSKIIYWILGKVEEHVLEVEEQHHPAGPRLFAIPKMNEPSTLQHLE